MMPLLPDADRQTPEGRALAPATGVRFTVYGIAQTKGSTRAFTPKGWRRPIITNTNRHAKGWEALIANAANDALQGRAGLLHSAVRVTFAFALPRPKSLPKRVTAHVKAPDVDKLSRCAADALSGVVYRDDSQVVELHASKRYAALGESPHVVVTIEAVDGAERWFPEPAR